MKIMLIGYSGRMGSLIKKKISNKHELFLIDEKNWEKFYAYINEVNLVIDFSSINAYELIRYALENHVSVIEGTTGYSDYQIDELKQIAQKNNTYYFYSYNYSEGIIKIEEILSKLVKGDYAIDLIETHHKNKKDVPSKTSLFLAKQIGLSTESIQSLRINTNCAKHEIVLSKNNEKITITHEALNLEPFVQGVLMKLNEFERSRCIDDA